MTEHAASFFVKLSIYKKSIKNRKVRKSENMREYMSINE